MLMNPSALRKKCPYLEFYWPVFPSIWTEYRDLQSKHPYSVRMQENTDQKTQNSDTFHAVQFPLLTHLFQIHPFSTPENIRNPYGFLMFSEVIERVQRKQMG